MRIYNAGSLDRNSRFLLAILASLVSALGFAIAYYFFISWSHIELSVFYIFFGWCIGEVIKKVGRGVTLKFAVLGAITTFLGILLADTFSSWGIQGGFVMLMHPSYWGTLLQSWVIMHVSTNINTILGLLFRVIGVYYGYWNSRIL